MFKVRISKKSLQQLESFISSYKRLFLNMYSDTGVIDEKIILESYKKLAKKLEDDILSNAQSFLEQQVVLGRKELSNSESSISYNIGNFLVVLLYEENTKLIEREIINITFYKK